MLKFKLTYWLLSLVLLGSILLAGCVKGTAQRNEPQKQPQKLLLFQKTPCFGTCPAYNATFYSDGSLLYEGFRYVPVQDTVRLQLTQEQLKQVQKSVQELDYTSLESSYLSPYTDLPSSYLTFYENDKEVKRVKHQVEGPEKLQQIIKELHELVMLLLTEK
ncbi:DUF6438 domain-containing protein [Pontibacter anaerobius]|uniref:DUF6438 domain-containing protein n=1 Tax=Pontibacter anaerobius TaxID=2993940 RepID=A0ABT3RJY5_9BACT|nr:DUF6438 domain-containing protein [Pontibacter anaerobius]MCX2741622.1 DUF6438 domain-containing protein [Pontibacter anaerobius]